MPDREVNGCNVLDFPVLTRYATDEAANAYAAAATYKFCSVFYPKWSLHRIWETLIVFAGMPEY